MTYGATVNENFMIVSALVCEGRSEHVKGWFSV